MRPFVVRECFKRAEGGGVREDKGWRAARATRLVCVSLKAFWLLFFFSIIAWHNYGHLGRQLKLLISSTHIDPVRQWGRERGQERGAGSGLASKHAQRV